MMMCKIQNNTYIYVLFAAVYIKTTKQKYTFKIRS